MCAKELNWSLTNNSSCHYTCLPFCSSPRSRTLCCWRLKIVSFPIGKVLGETNRSKFGAKCCEQTSVCLGTIALAFNFWIQWWPSTISYMDTGYKCLQSPVWFQTTWAWYKVKLLESVCRRKTKATCRTLSSGCNKRCTEGQIGVAGEIWKLQCREHSFHWIAREMAQDISKQCFWPNRVFRPTG